MYEFLNQLLSNSYGIYILCLASYLIGSISGSMLLGSFKGIDIRSKGSGNAGATNALRTVGPLFALGVIFIDVLKGFIPVYIIIHCTTEYLELYKVLIASFAVLGHVYPIYYKFKGGKGAGTLMGVILALFPQSFIYIFLSWLIILIFTGYVGLSTILAGISFVITTYFLYDPNLGFGIFTTPFGFFTLGVALFLIFTHRENIKRMLNGSENQFKKIMIFKK